MSEGIHVGQCFMYVDNLYNYVYYVYMFINKYMYSVFKRDGSSNLN